MKCANLEVDAFELEDASRLILFVITDFPCYTSADLAWLGHSLLDTCEERQQLLQEQEESLQQSIEIDHVDRRKQEEKKELLIQQDQEREEQERETARLAEAVRSSSLRVPAEPAVGAPRVMIAVHHVASGKLGRFFFDTFPAVRKCCLFTTGSARWLKSQRTLKCVSRRKSWLCRLTR